MALVVMEGLRYVAFKGQSNIHPAFSYYHSIPALIANILMLNCFLPYESWNAPVWSVCAEWFMYLLFPGLTFGLGCIRNASGLLILLALLFFGFCLVPDAYSNSQAYWIRCAFEFPMGCLIYFLIMRLYTQPAVLQTWIPILPWLYALALGLMLTSLMVGWREPWIVLTEFLVLLMMVLCHQCRLNRWLAWKPLHYLGEISYSIYLVHLPLHLSIINFSTKILHQNILALSPLQLSLLLSINSLLILICASLTYHFIEKPARDWLKVSGSMVYQSGKRYFANLAR
jgi:peptidoglycan/LPS O-acetylase OafA/YrhL